MSIEGQLEQERYDESMRGREAMGIPKVSFATWRMEQAQLDESFEEMKRQRKVAGSHGGIL